MLQTDSMSTHPFVGHALPPSVVDRLVVRPPWDQGRDTPVLAVMRDTQGRHDNTVQAVRGPGLGGRMFAESGREGDVYLLNPAPEAGKVYLGWEGDLSLEPHYFTHSGDGFVSIGPLDGPYGEPEMVLVPQVWAEANDPRPQFVGVGHVGFAAGAQISPPEDVSTPPAALADRFTQPGSPWWLHMVEPSPARDSYAYGRMVLVLAPGTIYDARTSQFTDQAWDATGQFRHVDTSVVNKDGVPYWIEVRPADVDDPPSLTSWPIIATTPSAALANQNSTPNTPHLVWWEHGQAEPVLTTSMAVRGVFRTEDGGERTAWRWVRAMGDAPPVSPASTVDLRVAIAEMERFWQAWSEAMNEVAEDDAWCEEYEAVVIPLGFPGREDRERAWVVRGWAIVDIEIDSPPSAVDRAVSNHIGASIEIGSMTVSGVSVPWSVSVTAVSSENASDQVGSGEIEEYLSANLEGDYSVNDWGVDGVEEDD